MFHFHYRQYLFSSDIDTKIFIRVTSSHYLSLHNIANRNGHNYASKIQDYEFNSKRRRTFLNDFNFIILLVQKYIS